MSRRRVGLALLACGGIAFGGCGSSDETGSGSPSSGKAAPAATPEQPGEGGGGAAQAGTATIEDFTFAPESVTVQAGGSVTWTNKDSANHNVVFDDKSVEGIGNLRQDQDGEVSFDKAGTYAYVCSYHPGMKGTVVVK